MLISIIVIVASFLVFIIGFNSEVRFIEEILFIIMVICVFYGCIGLFNYIFEIYTYEGENGVVEVVFDVSYLRNMILIAAIGFWAYKTYSSDEIGKKERKKKRLNTFKINMKKELIVSIKKMMIFKNSLMIHR
jgi:hypothetical protein